MRAELKITAQKENISKAVEFIERSLRQTALEQKKIYKNTLVSEEILAQMVKNADSEQSVLTIRIRAGKRNAKIDISCKGTEWNLEELQTVRSEMNLSELDDDEASIISQILIKALSEQLKLRYSHGVNFAYLHFRTAKTDHPNKLTLLFMLFGIALGLLLRILFPGEVCSFVAENVFSLGLTLFMNAVKMIVTPLVFFSIAESMLGFSDYKVFGKIGVKVLLLYLFTTAVAICLGYAVFQIIQPGGSSQINAVLAVSGATETQTASVVSIPDILVGIIPSNVTDAFLSGDMLQIIFVAMLTGIASTLLGKYSHPVQDFIKAANSLCAQITNMILKFLPFATLCFIANAILTTDVDSVTSLATVMLTVGIALLSMIVIYGILLVIAKINPFLFFAKFKRAMLTAFTTASSSGTMPVSMSALDQMGVSPKLYSFSIPLGATINMDGSSICYVIMVLFMMRVFGVQPDVGMLVSLFLTVMLLSIGTPGIPGAAIAMTALLFAQFEIPVGAVGFVTPVIILTEYLRTMTNVTGDAVITTIVAKSTGLLDKTKLTKKSLSREDSE